MHLKITEPLTGLDEPTGVWVGTSQSRLYFRHPLLGHWWIHILVRGDRWVKFQEYSWISCSFDVCLISSGLRLDPWRVKWNCSSDFLSKDYIYICSCFDLEGDKGFHPTAAFFVKTGTWALRCSASWEWCCCMARSQSLREKEASRTVIGSYVIIIIIHCFELNIMLFPQVCIYIYLHSCQLIIARWKHIFTRSLEILYAFTQLYHRQNKAAAPLSLT